MVGRGSAGTVDSARLLSCSPCCLQLLVDGPAASDNDDGDDDDKLSSSPIALAVKVLLNFEGSENLAHVSLLTNRTARRQHRLTYFA